MISGLTKNYYIYKYIDRQIDRYRYKYRYRYRYRYRQMDIDIDIYTSIPACKKSAQFINSFLRYSRL